MTGQTAARHPKKMEYEDGGSEEESEGDYLMGGITAGVGFAALLLGLRWVMD